ncbi:MAG: ATP-binding cassette domain-containing protein [Lachnospiraceae bacterium]|nr:ATP-binding cassette domain-containing protein [Lachnospiraceae bacterium]
MIEAKNIQKMFTRNVLAEGKKKSSKKSVKEEFYALDGISLQAKAGEIVGILGPNGAGKTTLLRILGMLMQPTAGEVLIRSKEGEYETDPVKVKQNIGYLSGNTKLYHRLSTREMLRMLGEVYGIEKQQCEERIGHIFDVLDMEQFGDNRIEKLSTGQTQRANIARCLIHDPDLYIFDEPTLGLDILSADAIVNFMKGQKELGKTVLYSTHYLEEAQFLCDKIYMIYQGKIVREGSPSDIMQETKTGNLRDAFHVVMDQVKGGDAQ